MHRLELYATNDIHGRFFNTPLYDGREGASLANVCTYISERRKIAGNDNLLLLDCGDNLQGDMAVWMANAEIRRGAKAGHIYPKVAQYIGYDAVLPGNHDFEAGPQVCSLIQKELEEAGIPLLGANVLDKETGKSLFKPYIIINRGGIRVAVIGMANPLTAKWIPDNLRAGMTFSQIKPIAEKIIKEIKENGRADLITMILHSGFGDGNSVEGENVALALAGALEGVDIIFAGHDHTPGCCRVGNTLLLSATPQAHSIQRALVEFEKDGEKIVVGKIEGEIVSMEGVAEDKGYLEHFSSVVEEVGQFSNEPVGILECEIDSRKALAGECRYLALLHSVQLEASGADISFASPYMYDSILPAGKILRKDLFRMYSCENTLYKIRMTGQQIKEYLEYSYQSWICTLKGGEEHLLRLCSTEVDGEVFWWPENFTYNLDSAAGIIYSVDVTREYGDRIKIKGLWNGEPFLLGESYQVALSSYRVSGGGGLFDCGAGIDPERDLPGITVSRYTYIRDLLEKFIGDRREICMERCGHWDFVPQEKAAHLLANDMRLLFGE